MYGADVLCAARYHHFPIMKKILEKAKSKSDGTLARLVNAQDASGNTALHYATGNEEMRQMLESYGANPSLRNMYGLLPSSGHAPKSFADFAGLM